MRFDLVALKNEKLIVIGSGNTNTYLQVMSATNLTVNL